MERTLSSDTPSPCVICEWNLLLTTTHTQIFAHRINCDWVKAIMSFFWVWFIEVTQKPILQRLSSLGALKNFTSLLNIERNPIQNLPVTEIAPVEGQCTLPLDQTVRNIIYFTCYTTHIVWKELQFRSLIVTFPWMWLMSYEWRFTLTWLETHNFIERVVWKSWKGVLMAWIATDVGSNLTGIFSHTTPCRPRLRIYFKYYTTKLHIANAIGFH